MLKELRAVNFAIIDEALIEFSEGLNVLTGETGAGKSILIEALGLALGSRSSEEMIRFGSEVATVEASFDISKLATVENWLNDLGYSCEGELILRRVVNRSGKSRAYLNGSPITIAQIRSIGERLVDIHGQNEHQSLLNPVSHMPLFDGFLGLNKKLSVYQASYNDLVTARDRLAKANSNRMELEQKVDLLKYQIEEINGASLKPKEDTALTAEKNRLVNTKKLLELSSSIVNDIDEAEDSVINITNAIRSLFDQIVGIDPSVKPMAEKLTESFYGLEEVSAEVRQYANMIDDGRHGRLDEVDERLELIKNLKRKYGSTIEEIISHGKSAEMELDTLSYDLGNNEKLEDAVAELTKNAGKLASELDLERQKGSKKFSAAVIRLLSDLNMGKVKLAPKFSYEESEDGYLQDGVKQKLGPLGFGEMELLFSANPGEPPKSLVKTASGGEISRLMLALKTVAREQLGAASMIFDEVDAGIGGATADMLGRKLKALAGSNQIFVITHLSQVAKYANAHFRVEKKGVKDRVTAKVKELTEDERIIELARMTAGTNSARSNKSAIKWARVVRQEVKSED